ncbi:MAG: ATP-binding protein [Acidimicrobiales bacterium]|nr:ATP-binding protein [Acidimicrobiales bacterium]
MPSEIFRRQVVPRAAELSALRIDLHDALRSIPRVGRDVASRVAIAVSELGTNVARHGPPSPVTVRADLDNGELTVDVDQLDPVGAIPPVEEWNLPNDPLAATGRGLAIVRQVADWVRLHRLDRRVIVRLGFSLESSSSDALRASAHAG